MKKIYGVVLGISSLLISAVPAAVAQTTDSPQPPAASASAPTWTIDQAVTSTVHDAWVLGGRNEKGFFAIVEALADLSAEKRGLTLPDNAETGRKFGQYIKTQAQTDRDQLLYAVVDHAVRVYGTKSSETIPDSTAK